MAREPHSHLRWHARLALALALAGSIVALPVVANAQSAKKKPAGKSLSTQVAEQRKEIAAQKKLLEEQKTEIENQKALAGTQAATIDSLLERQKELDETIRILNRRLEDIEAKAGVPAWQDSLELRLKQIEEASKKTPELPPDVVSAGDFPGSIRIPGSDAALKFGGRIRTAVVLTLDPLGTDDRFLTNSIPVGVDTLAGDARRTNISARASRVNLEFRTPTGRQELRAFFEGDFAGTNNSFRLRHAYAQYRGVIVGQTWSTFSDPWADFEDLDFEGVSSENVTRQPLLRYWWGSSKNTRTAFAIETPLVSLTGGVGVNLFPDVIGRVFWGNTTDWHLQFAGVLRQIRGESQAGDVRSDWAGGGSVSGVLPLRWKGLRDRVIFQVNAGAGIARYINDLSSLGGQDAVFDPATGELEALPAFGWYVAYEHRWKTWNEAEGRTLRSTALWSLVRVNNLDSQPPDAYFRTNRFMANVVFSPIRRVDVGFEHIYGERTNNDQQKGHANQMQVVMLCRF